MFVTNCLLVSILFQNRNNHHSVHALKICVAGGTGNLGKLLASKLQDRHDVTILSRNAYLASSPSRVTETFGWLGKAFLEQNPHVNVRDWDGGDLLDIVGNDWLGWQDTLAEAHVIINLVGGYTNQRVMATERIVRESMTFNPTALQVMVSPRTIDDLKILSPGATSMKWDRLQKCEDMVKHNCIRYNCLRLEANLLDHSCNEIVKAIDEEPVVS